jgi:hypothetical protein
MRAQLKFALTTAALISVLATAPAFAARQHSFVASTGNDSNACSFLQPCATFQHALSVTVSGGEITAIDSDGFGSLTISQSITITAAPGTEANVPPVPGASSIVVTGSGINVILRNLTLNAAGSGYNGIDFQAGTGSSLTVINCTIVNFLFETNNDAITGNGILIEPSTGAVTFAITNTTVSNNANNGIVYAPPASSATSVIGVLGNVTAANNTNGIKIAPQSGTADVTISDSVATNNSGDGIAAANLTPAGQALTVTIDNTTLTSNATGISAANTTKVLLGRSVIIGNTTYGIDNTTSPNTFYTYKDNRVDLNGTSTADDVEGDSAALIGTTPYIQR